MTGWLITFGVLLVGTAALILASDFMEGFKEEVGAPVGTFCVAFAPLALLGALFFGRVFGGFWWVTLGTLIGLAFAGILAGVTVLGKALAAAVAFFAPIGAVLAVIFFGDILPIPRWLTAIIAAIAVFLPLAAINAIARAKAKAMRRRQEKRAAEAEAEAMRRRQEKKAAEAKVEAMQRQQEEARIKRLFDDLLKEIQRLANGAEKKRLGDEVEKYRDKVMPRIQGITIKQLENTPDAEMREKIRLWEEQVEKTKMDHSCRECGLTFVNDTDKFCNKCGAERGIKNQ